MNLTTSICDNGDHSKKNVSLASIGNSCSVQLQSLRHRISLASNEGSNVIIGVEKPMMGFSGNNWNSKGMIKLAQVSPF